MQTEVLLHMRKKRSERTGVFSRFENNKLLSMNKIVTLLFLSIAVTAVSAQRQSEAVPFTSELSGLESSVRTSGDTLANFALDEPCAADPIIFTSVGGGFVNGTNGYGDLEKVQLIFLPSSGTGACNEVLVFFGGKSVDGDGTVKALVYEVAGDGSPGELLGESDPVNVSLCDTAGLFTAFPIATPDSFIDIFFAGIDVSDTYPTGDSIGVLSTDDGCGNGEEVWEKWSDGVWYPYVGEGTWNLNIALFIYGVVDWEDNSPPASLDDAWAVNGGLTLHPAYPDPANQQVSISYGLAEPSGVELTMYNQAGQIVYQWSGQQTAGEQLIAIETSQWPSGKYYYQVAGAQGILFSSLMVQH